MPFKYDPRLHRNTGGYRDDRGRIVSRDAVRKEIVNYIDRSDLRRITQQLQQGKIPLNQWESEMRIRIKDGHVNAVIAERGGVDNMTRNDYLRAGRRVKREYAALSQWSRQIASGEAPVDGRLLSRADLYAEAAYATYAQEVALTMRDAPEYTEERSIPDPSVKNHCIGCENEARRGWVPIGSLKPIGERDCRSRDRCHITYR